MQGKIYSNVKTDFKSMNWNNIPKNFEITNDEILTPEILTFEPEQAITGYVYDFDISKPPIELMGDFIEELNNSNIPVGAKFKMLAYIAATSKPETMTSEEENVYSLRIENDRTMYYNFIHDLAGDQAVARGRDDYNRAYGSCAQAVCNIVTLTYDPDFPSDGPLEQYKYLSAPDNNKWECIHENLQTGTEWPNDMQEGDIIVSVDPNKEGGHVLMYVGRNEVIPLFYEAAYYQQDDGLYSSTYPVIDQVDTVTNRKEGRQTYIFRPTQ